MGVLYISILIAVLVITGIIFNVTTKQAEPADPLKKFRDYYADIDQHALSRNQSDMMGLFLAGYPPKTKENAKGRIVIADGGSIVYRTATLRSLIQRGYLKRTGGDVTLAFVSLPDGSTPP